MITVPAGPLAQNPALPRPPRLRLVRTGRRRRLKIAATWPWAPAIVTAWNRITALPQAPSSKPPLRPKKGAKPSGARGTPGDPARQPGHRHTQVLNQDPLREPAAITGQRPIGVNDQG